MYFSYLKEFWEKYFEKMPLIINPFLNPSSLIVGESGSGKSYALKWLIRNLLQDISVDFYFCNYKDSLDFRF